MEYHIRDARHEDGSKIIDIYNHFVLNSWSSYLEEAVQQSWFEALWSNVPDYPLYVIESDTEFIAWGLAKPYSTLARKCRTAEVSYFILAEHQGKGLGKKLLQALIESCQQKGIKVLLASIMAVNEQSIHFHEKSGFSRVGVMHKVIEKWGKVVDMLWMEKYIGD